MNKIRFSMRISPDTKEILEKLSKKYKMSKVEVIETLLENIYNTDLEKILLVIRSKSIIKDIIKIDNNININQLEKEEPKIQLREEKENKIDLTETKPKEQKQEKKEGKKQEKKEEKKEEKKDEKIWIDLDTFFDDLK